MGWAQANLPGRPGVLPINLNTRPAIERIATADVALDRLIADTRSAVASRPHHDVRIILVHAPGDNDVAKKLGPHLKVLKSSKSATLWEPGDIRPGSMKEDEWTEQITRAHIALVLLSAEAAMKGDFRANVLDPLLARAERKELRLIPILARAWYCAGDAKLVKLEMLPRDGRALITLSETELDTALAHIARELEEAVDEMPQPEACTGVYPTGRASSRDGAADGEVGPSARAGNGSLDNRSLPAHQRRYAHAVSQKEEAKERRTRLKMRGVDTSAVDAEIRDLARNSRQNLRPGDTLREGRYEVSNIIGRGGFGTVWKAWDCQDRREVAIKVMHGAPSEEVARWERFQRGARLMLHVGHDAIVPVVEPPFVEGRLGCFTMALMTGGTFEQAVLEGRIGPEKVLHAILVIGEALAAAHKHGVVHRDVKPTNILFDALGNARLTDFDLVLAPDTTGGTASGAGMGSLVYAAPELLSGESARAAPSADVFGLGMTLLFGLHGKKLPIEAWRDSGSIIDKLDCRDPIKSVLKRALAPQPAQRYVDARSFVEALESAHEERRGENRSFGSSNSSPASIPGRNIVAYDCALIGLGYAERDLVVARRAIDEWNDRLSRRLKARVEIAYCGPRTGKERTNALQLDHCDLGVAIMTPGSSSDSEGLWLDGKAELYQLLATGRLVLAWRRENRTAKNNLPPILASAINAASHHVPADRLITGATDAELRDAILGSLTEIIGNMPRTREMVGDVSSISALDIDVRMTIREELLNLFDKERYVVVHIQNQALNTIQVMSITFEAGDGIKLPLEVESVADKLSLPMAVEPHSASVVRFRHEQWAHVADGRQVRAVVITSCGRIFRSRLETAGTLLSRAA